jgi:quinol monooxygenase YgiN
MGEPYTQGIYRVKPGRVEEFVLAWVDFAQVVTEEAEGALWGMLLRDVGDPNRFVSYGAWESREAIERWSERDVWQDALGRFSTLFDSFELGTLEFVAARDPTSRFASVDAPHDEFGRLSTLVEALDRALADRDEEASRGDELDMQIRRTSRLVRARLAELLGADQDPTA